MSTGFEEFLKAFSQHSKMNVTEGDFSAFGYGMEDTLLWDPHNRVGVMERHNYALAFWLDYLLNSGINPVLVHIDRHQDMGRPKIPEKGKMKNTEFAAKYIDGLSIKKFIEPAAEWGFFSDIELRGDANSFKDVGKLVQLAKSRGSHVIFDLDMDVYQKNPYIIKKPGEVPGNHRDQCLTFEQSYEAFAELMYHSDLTTVAFSPDYITNSSEIERHYRQIARHYSNYSGSSGLSGVRKLLPF